MAAPSSLAFRGVYQGRPQKTRDSNSRPLFLVGREERTQYRPDSALSFKATTHVTSVPELKPFTQIAWSGELSSWCYKFMERLRRKR